MVSFFFFSSNCSFSNTVLYSVYWKYNWLGGGKKMKWKKKKETHTGPTPPMVLMIPRLLPLWLFRCQLIWRSKESCLSALIKVDIPHVTIHRFHFSSFVPSRPPAPPHDTSADNISPPPHTLHPARWKGIKICNIDLYGSANPLMNFAKTDSATHSWWFGCHLLYIFIICRSTEQIDWFVISPVVDINLLFCCVNDFCSKYSSFYTEMFVFECSRNTLWVEISYTAFSDAFDLTCMPFDFKFLKVHWPCVPILLFLVRIAQFVRLHTVSSWTFVSEASASL